jgi:hypothetical protein
VASNFLGGVTQDAESANLASLPFPDPTACHTWFDDFDDYVAGQWTITETGSGTRAVGDLDGGVLVITNAASDNDHNYLQWSGDTSGATRETWTFTAGKKSWFKARLKISDATESDMFMGLYVTDTDPVGALSDGVYFNKADGSAVCNLVVANSSTATTTAAATLVSDTYVTLGFAYDGIDKIEIFVNDNRVANSVTTNLPTTELALSFAIQNGSIGAKSMSIDYILVSKER